MSVITKGLGASPGGGAFVTKGLQAIMLVPPEYIPGLERAAVPGSPDVVKAHTPTSVYRALLMWLQGKVYGY